MSSQSHLAEPQINATPLIDVLLVLIVMLILTVPVATHAVKLNLPQPDGAPPPSTVFLDITHTGEIYFNGQLVRSIEELTPKLVGLTAWQDQPVLQVVADKRAPYGRVAQVLAAAQRSKVVKISVNPVRG